MLRRTIAPLFSSLIPKPTTSSISRVLQQRHPQSLRFLASAASSSEQIGDGDGSSSGKKGFFRRRAVPILLLGLTGSVALSGLNDLAIFHGCSSKAIERASQNLKVTEALGDPIVRGPWYDATLAVSYRRNTVSCTFPVSGPQGSGIFQLKAVRTGDDNLFSFLWNNEWDILVMQALLHVPTNDEKQRTFRVNLMDVAPPPCLVECKECTAPESQASEK